MLFLVQAKYDFALSLDPLSFPWVIAMNEKESYKVKDDGYSPELSDTEKEHGQIRDHRGSVGGAIGEAADVYGNIEEAEKLKYVNRG